MPGEKSPNSIPLEVVGKETSDGFTTFRVSVPSGTFINPYSFIKFNLSHDTVEGIPDDEIKRQILKQMTVRMIPSSER